ncbi:MAG: EamA/RhaT family transporter [Sphingobacteriales bacterium]|nr:MAG: EamA/RhaT family transporter [Sphingobacteriales bacterium]
MLYLIATILLNILLFVFFKLFPKYKIDTLQAIVFNYITCVITGSLFIGSFPVNRNSLSEPWAPWALLMGVCFISLFNLIGYCTKKEGITATTIANKLSLVIPVLFSVFLYDEDLRAGKIVGILLAVPAVYLSTRRPEEAGKAKHLWLPALLFAGSGLLDTLVKYVEQTFLEDPASQAVFTIHCFAVAATIGSLIVAGLLISGKRNWSWRNVLAGVLLGIPNYFSIYCLIRLLHSDFMQSSAAIPVNNIGIVLLSTVVAVLFFKEGMSRQKLAGIGLSLIAILLIALSDIYGFF